MAFLDTPFTEVRLGQNDSTVTGKKKDLTFQVFKAQTLVEINWFSVMWREKERTQQAIILKGSFVLFKGKK